MPYNTGNPVPSTDPRDFKDNVEAFDYAMNGTGTFTDRLGNTRDTYDKFLDDNQVDADALNARLAVRAYYTDTTAFLAATSDGQYGYVGNQLYRNNAGVAQNNTMSG